MIVSALFSATFMDVLINDKRDHPYYLRVEHKINYKRITHESHPPLRSLSSVEVRPVRREVEAVGVAQRESTGVIHFAGSHAGIDDAAARIGGKARGHQYVAVLVDFGTVRADAI